MVLTLDPFAMMSRTLRVRILDETRRLADRDDDIIDEDRRHVIVCPVAQLERVLHTSNEDIFLGALQAAQREQYADWQFREIHRDTEAGRNFGPTRRFPFDLGELLPWWAAAEGLASAQGDGRRPAPSPGPGGD